MSDDLIDRARQAAERAYAPYSNFRVGAAVLTEDGSVFEAANVENAAYPSGLCAESGAIVAAVSAGHRKLRSLAVACIDAKEVDESYPCGQCRQRMNEFGVEEVLIATADGEVARYALADLLPHGFRLGH
ncbi:MAG: cytidine deaminase [Acidimicrobiia bacterium]